MTFREIYTEIADYEGERLFEDCLAPFVPQAKKLMPPLQRYRKRNSAENPYTVDKEDLWDFYALSRINDFLICKLPESLSQDDYIRFFTDLGFASLLPTGFSPFFTEVVEVAEMDEASDPLASQVFWMGLVFGSMLFSRAGIRVLCKPAYLLKEIADKSPLYFTYRRLNRPTVDLSMGWGHNSQWATQFRRDYFEKNVFHYNVDGRFDLDVNYQKVRAAALPGIDFDEITLEQRIELLTNRCFIRTPNLSTDLWPFDDRWTEVVEPRELNSR